jgi:hypothetical protein
MCVAALVLAGIAPAPAQAALSVASFDQQVLAADGTTLTQAGAHPDAVRTDVTLETTTNALGNAIPRGGNLKDLIADLPLGFAGNPKAVPECPVSLFVAGAAAPVSSSCPAATQIGLMTLTIAVGGAIVPIDPVPVYNVKPPPGVAAEFVFKFANAIVFLDASLRDDDYGVRVTSRNASQVLTFVGASLTLWGVPADSKHEGERFCLEAISPGCVSDAAKQAFFANPTSCGPEGVGGVTKLRVFAWDDRNVFTEASSFAHVAGDPGSQLATMGCDLLPFHPSFALRPDSLEPDAPTGLAVDVSFPLDGLVNPTGLAGAHLRTARVVLPEGMTVSPSSADGLQACSDEQLAVGTHAPIRCPEASKIGTIVATTPVLDEPLEGGIYVGSQKSDDPESGEMFRIFLVLENDERGIRVKLPGRVRANKDTGRIETVFTDLPQVPVGTFSLRFKSGPRAPLATPPSCGEKTVEAVLTSWGGQVANLKDTFDIECPAGLGGFEPSFEAGTILPAGGAFSPLAVRINRPDRQQYLSGVSVEMPGGLLAKLKGVALCGEAQASAGTCPSESRVGTATVAAGPGSTPFFVQGPVYLTGPYGGGPYGLSVAVRAVAGPFDLGTVVVRQALFVDPVDAHVSVRSDPIPSIVKGVPLRLRSVNVDVDRPNFTLNPTSCSEKQIGATFASTQNAISKRVSRFEAADCRELGFSPRLTLRLTGRRQTTTGRHPGLKAVLTQPRGQAGIRKAAVELPLSLALDPEHAASDDLCEFEEGQKPDPHCPPSSVIGTATALTPLLNHPLTGNVYFVKNVRIDKQTGRRIRTLPTLLVALRGEVSLNLRATTSIRARRLVSTFAAVPDAPVSRFTLNLEGGRRGILTVNGDICRRKQRAARALTGQNRVRSDRSIRIGTPCPHQSR